MEIGDHDSIVVTLAGESATIRKELSDAVDHGGDLPQICESLVDYVPHGLICVIPNDVIQGWIDDDEAKYAQRDSIKRVTPIIDQYLEIDALPEHLPTNHKG